mmetsp:Transcript_68399/g.154897  ORF Transcript_68399/g.154897 Transcript_68399/m.154897 type:complete len:298 (+) Transcript_68399:106-999(+)
MRAAVPHSEFQAGASARPVTWKAARHAARGDNFQAPVRCLALERLLPLRLQREPDVGATTSSPHEEGHAGGGHRHETHEKPDVVPQELGRFGLPCRFVVGIAQLSDEPRRELERELLRPAAGPGTDTLTSEVVDHRRVVLHVLLVAERLVSGAVHPRETDDVPHGGAGVVTCLVFSRPQRVVPLNELARGVPVHAEEDDPMIGPVSFEHVANEEPAVQWSHGRLMWRSDDDSCRLSSSSAGSDKGRKEHERYGQKGTGAACCHSEHGERAGQQPQRGWPDGVHRRARVVRNAHPEDQ